MEISFKKRNNNQTTLQLLRIQKSVVEAQLEDVVVAGHLEDVVGQGKTLGRCCPQCPSWWCQWQKETTINQMLLSCWDNLI